MKSAFDIASYFLEREREKGVDLITPLKLQKLLYYAQAWNLAFTGEILFRENLEAWVHGPVVPCVYREFRHYGYGRLPKRDSSNNLKTDEVNILNVVLSVYGGKSAKFLEMLSHSEYPWRKAREGLNSTQTSKRKISLQDMMNFYKPLIENNNPPQIKPIALQVKKSHMKKSFTNNFFIGIGSVLDLIPRSSSQLFYAPDDFSDVASDSEAIASDWEKVGGDIQYIFKLVEKKAKNNHE